MKKLAGTPGFAEREKAGGGDQVFCYVNSVFAPGLDEGVGGLWKVSLTGLMKRPCSPVSWEKRHGWAGLMQDFG